MSATTSRLPRILIALAATAAVTTMLSGCSMLQQLAGGGNDATRDDNGEVVEGNDEADVFLLKVGDCINDSELDDVVTTLPIVPCSEPHDSETYAEGNLQGDEYPGDDTVSSQSDQICYDAFAGFVGISYEESTLGYYPFTPTQESWNSGDRLVSCMIYDPAGQTTGSLAGSAK